MRWISPLAACLLLAGTAGADLSKVDRSIPKEPAYKTKSQKYALVVVGPEAKQRLWLVLDGDELHVLGDKPTKLAAKKEDDGLLFELEQVALGGTTHHNLRVGVASQKRLAASVKDPDAQSLFVALDVVAPHIKKDGLVPMMAGPNDLNGPLVLATRPADAPVLHFGGPLEVTFYSERPKWKRDRSAEASLVVGTPGLGAGTFVMLLYEDVIPPAARPKLDVTFAAATPGSAPAKRLYELKERC